jgi:uncharacterized protein
MMMDPVNLIDRFYKQDDPARAILLTHSRCVADKALEVAHRLDTPVDLAFIEEAAMLHDIGILATDAPNIHCYGSEPYLRHGPIGHNMLMELGLPKHARVCERHTGVGLSAEDILKNQLPLPARDMRPETLEEQIICYADNFYRKTPGLLTTPQTPEQIMSTLSRFGEDKVQTWKEWHQRFG